MIINLTQHIATDVQKEFGVIEPRDKASIQELLTFNSVPTSSSIKSVALALAEVAKEEVENALRLQGVSEEDMSDHVCGVEVMVGGAPYLMGPLEEALKDKLMVPVYSFSERVSMEDIGEDGYTFKYNVFRHIGFIVA